MLLLYLKAFLARQPVLTTGDYRRLRQRYIIAYTAVMGIIFMKIVLTFSTIFTAADWFQGPNVVALYLHYGFTLAEAGIAHYILSMKNNKLFFTLLV